MENTAIASLIENEFKKHSPRMLGYLKSFLGFSDRLSKVPYDYHANWIEEKKLHYNEQYIFAAYLLGGGMGDTIELPVNYLAHLPECRGILEDLWSAIAPIQSLEKENGGFFWMRRKK